MVFKGFGRRGQQPILVGLHAYGATSVENNNLTEILTRLLNTKLTLKETLLLHSWVTGFHVPKKEDMLFL